ncbi:MAG: pseudouridine synthase [Pseudomonadota bacterium]|nr:pseudouridine synthase [Pseudomonadota bacterium]
MNTKNENQSSEKNLKPERIAKVIARAGICSRREAEKLIIKGCIKVDGKILTTPAVTVTNINYVEVDGQPLPNMVPMRLWRFHKPKGLLTSHADPQGRPTVFEQLPKSLGRVISVGRLDFNSEGLLLLTNDGELARRLELPKTGWVRRYRVRVHGLVDEGKLKGLADGAKVAGVSYGPISAVLDNKKGSNSWLTVSLNEGRNREIRRVMKYLGLEVTRLIRIAFGPFQLGNLSSNRIEEISGKVIREQLGGESFFFASSSMNKSGWAAKSTASRRKPS